MKTAKFAANLGMMFTKEAPSLVERYKLAADAGFAAVEVAFPYDVPVEEIAAARSASGMEQVLINAYPGEISKGDLGMAIHSHRQEEFRQSLETSIKYLKALDCKRLHIMAGKVSSGQSVAELNDMYVKNLRFAAERLEKEKIVALIEPCNAKWVPNYYMNDFQKALDVIAQVNHPNLKLQFDVFHAQIIQGNLSDCIKKCFPLIGHVQIAQVPDRSEPNSPGEINYEYVINLFHELGYEGWFGLEYIPRGTTVEGLTFFNKTSSL